MDGTLHSQRQMIEANNFVRQWDEIRDDAIRVFDQVGSGGWYVLGDEVRLFERDLAAYWGADQAVGVASGLDAIEISLRILGCSPGDRVLTTPLSAFATTLAILKLNAIPVFVDTDGQGLIDLARCADVLESRPDIRFFVPVHVYGLPLSMNRLRLIGDQFGTRIVEDCAQSIGARIDNQSTGSVGHLAATSFYPTKNLGAMGDGGAILTNDPALAEQARAYRDYGQTAKYRHQLVGYNSRLDELQASFLGRVCLPRLERWTDRRRAIASRYIQELHHGRVRVCAAPRGSSPSWHLFPVFVHPSLRDHFQAHLKNCGVASGIHYPFAIPDQPALAGTKFELADECETARRLCESEVSLPIHPFLAESEVDLIVESINTWRPGG